MSGSDGSDLLVRERYAGGTWKVVVVEVEGSGLFIAMIMLYGMERASERFIR